LYFQALQVLGLRFNPFFNRNVVDGKPCSGLAFLRFSPTQPPVLFETQQVRFF
jgi:hypothetical protein